MALRDQPYLPLYVQDFLTDEKLAECSAMATGIYIRIMCIMHKSNDYGIILLQQKDKQNSSKIKNFALKLVRHLPYSETIIIEGLQELINEGVLLIEEDKLIQKRMVADNNLSLIRQKSAKSINLANAKGVANTENENENTNENEIAIKNEKKTKYCFSENLILYGANENLVKDWLIVRKNKKASNTETAFTGFIKEVKKSNKSINEILELCVQSSWSGFKNEWLNNKNNGTKQTETERRNEERAILNKSAIEILTRNTTENH